MALELRHDICRDFRLQHGTGSISTAALATSHLCTFRQTIAPQPLTHSWHHLRVCLDYLQVRHFLTLVIPCRVIIHTLNNIDMHSTFGTLPYHTYTLTLFTYLPAYSLITCSAWKRWL
jgi:hypothetical protein